MKKPYVVGITGCSGSGKTYLLNRLVQNFSSSEMVVLSMDNHYKPIDQQVRDENNVVNFDLPES
ncbi:MAG: GTP-binding protein, partial [Cyclobacteriaceae bacterium]